MQYVGRVMFRFVRQRSFFTLTLLILLVLGRVWLMCRSVYLSGLLMSHGTDSVRTRRATTEHTGTMKQRGRLKLHNTRLIGSGKWRETHYQVLLLIRKMNKLPSLERHPFVIANRQKKSLLKQMMSLRNLSFSLTKAGEGSLINALYLELFLGGLIWGEKGVVGGAEKRQKNVNSKCRCFFFQCSLSQNKQSHMLICKGF